MSRRWLLAITAQMVSAPMANLNQLASTSETTMPLSIARIRTTPITAPSTIPTPPPAAEGSPPDHCGGNGLQLQPVAEGRQRGAQPHDLQHAGKAGQHRA